MRKIFRCSLRSPHINTETAILLATTAVIGVTAIILALALPPD